MVIEIPCTKCGLPVEMKESKYKSKRALGQQTFYHKACFKQSSPWRKKYE